MASHDSPRSSLLVRGLACGLVWTGCADAGSATTDTDGGSSGIVLDGGADEGTAGGDASTRGSGVDDSGDGPSSGGPNSDGPSGGDDGLPPPYFDVGSPEGVIDCGAGDASSSFSIIWIANSPEGTVSKIDTATAVELARYRTGPGSADPSRTSVNLAGDVAVSNRRGSVTKIAGSTAACVDSDGDGEIRTSSGPSDVLPWGEDECVLWHVDTGFDATIAGSTGGPRATAWTAGTLDEDTCRIEGADLWVSWRNQPASSATIRRLDGNDGTTIGEVVIAAWPDNWGHGPYGGAADKDGNLWALGTSGSMFRIDGVDFGVLRWDNPVNHVMYGIALDGDGDPWVAGYGGKLWHFDREGETWVDKGGTGGGPARMRGLAIDSEGHAWIAGNNPCALIRYDTVADVLVDGAIALPGCGQPVGVSIDSDGRVWVVDRDADQAYRVDPIDGSIVTVPGLVDPYTYSDMTGAGLGLVAGPQG